MSEFDDWEMAGGEEDMIVKSGEPLPRVVFGGAPSLQEATEATSDLKDALEKVYLSQPASDYGGSCISGSSLLPFSKACVVSEAVVTPSAPKHAIHAFRFLSEIPAAQGVVASIACDPNVWTAVLQNPALQEFLESQETSASFPESDQKMDDCVADTDSFSQSSPRSAFFKSEAEDSKSKNSFTGILKFKVHLLHIVSSCFFCSTCPFSSTHSENGICFAVAVFNLDNMELDAEVTFVAVWSLFFFDFYGFLLRGSSPLVGCEWLFLQNGTHNGNSIL